MRGRLMGTNKHKTNVYIIYTSLLPVTAPSYIILIDVRYMKWRIKEWSYYNAMLDVSVEDIKMNLQYCANKMTPFRLSDLPQNFTGEAYRQGC